MIDLLIVGCLPLLADTGGPSGAVGGSSAGGNGGAEGGEEQPSGS